MFKISCKYVIPKENPAYWEINAAVEKPERVIDELKSKVTLEELCQGVPFNGERVYFLKEDNNLLKIYTPDNQVNKTVIEILRAYLVRFEQ